MQSTSCEILGWMKHKLESRLPGEISITSDNTDDTVLMAESEKQLKSLLMKVKVESEKAGLTLNIQNGIQSHHFMANRWGNSRNSVRLFFWALKSLQMVTAAMKLKDAYSLEGKL